MKLAPSESEGEGPNLTPVIDIVFLLLIFFLVATKFNEEEKEIDTKLAEVSQGQPLSSPPNEIIVNVSDEGEFKINRKVYLPTDLNAMLRDYAQHHPSGKVQVRCDEDARFRYAAFVMGCCEEFDIKHTVTVLQKKKKS